LLSFFVIFTLNLTHSSREFKDRQTEKPTLQLAFLLMAPHFNVVDFLIKFVLIITITMAEKVIIKGVEWTPQMVKEAIAKSDEAVKRALLRLYSFQTEDEKQNFSTHHTNGKGFNGTDAEILSSFADQLLKKGWLSQKQLELSRKKLLKYSRQIFNWMKEERQTTYRKFGL